MAKSKTDTKTTPKASETKTPEKSARPEPGDVVTITLKRKATLGEGEREPGTELAEVCCRPGVSIREVVNALRNPQYVGLT